MPEVLAAPEAARLTDLARAFKAAARAVVLYPDSHPAIASTLSRLTQVTTPPAQSAPVRISVTSDALMIGGLAPPKPDAAIAELAALLHSHLIGEITILPDGDADEWRTLLRLLARAPDTVRAEGGVARVWITLAGRHVEIREIDYAEVLRERHGGAAASWQEIIANCLSGNSFDLPEELLNALIEGLTDAEALADVITALEIEAVDAGFNLAERAAALARLLRGIVTAVALRAPERTQPVMRDLAMALGHSSPDLILSLVARGRQEQEVDATVVSIVNQMPDGAVAGFVARHTLEGNAPIERVAQAFQALVVDPDRRERLVAMAHDTAVVAGAEGEAFEASWQEIARTLLSQYSDQPFVSDTYARELTTLREQAVQIEQLNEDPPERRASWLATVSTTELRRMDLALVLDLLRIEQDAAKREALLVPVVALIEDLLFVGDFDSASVLLGALRADADHDEAFRRDAAREALDRLVTPVTMRHIVGHLATADDAQALLATEVCLALGEALVRPLAEALSSEERSRTRERLTTILIGFGAVGRREVEQLKTSANPAVRRTAIYLLREFGGSEALPELADLLDDAEPAVQREAVRAILLIGSDEAYRVLEDALASGTPQSRESVMQALGALRDDRAAPLLTNILERVSHRGPIGWVYARALDLLGQLRDPQTVGALEKALYRGEWWAPRRTGTLRRSAAHALARIGTADAMDALSRAVERGPRGVRAAARAQIEAVSRDPFARGRS
jgi:hypothetical protein